MEKLKRLLKTLDDNLLLGVLSLFIFLIPLYPKLPLMRVEYTYIHIRADDFFLVTAAVVFFIQLLRRKATINIRFLIPFMLFWLAIFASFIFHVYIAETMPYKQVAFLHTVRRVEYMIMFFIAYAAVRKKSDFYVLLFALLSSFVLVLTYAIGQKFIGFPAVQTMNPAFARGMVLLLTPEARISGTFAGHYDIASYLVMLIPFIWGMHLSKNFFPLTKKQSIAAFVIAAISIMYVATNMRVTSWEIIVVTLLVPAVAMSLLNQKLREKALTATAAITGIFVLIFTASRISFGAYMISTPVFLFVMKKFRYCFIVVVITALAFMTSRDLANRFSKTFQVKQILVNEKTGQVFVPQKLDAKELPAGSAFINLNEDRPVSTETEEYKEKVIREATGAGKILNDKEKKELLASLSADIKPVTGFVPDISFATRLQVEWPRAIASFKKNPLLGTGPFSITEATDNDYLRALGEFGILGFGTFFYLLAFLAWNMFKRGRRAGEQSPLFLGLIFGLGGLLFNATYIDVFEASKVAYVLWFVWGITTAYLELATTPGNTLLDATLPTENSKQPLVKKVKKNYGKKRNKK